MMWFLQMAQLSTWMSTRVSINERELTPSPEGYCVPLLDFKALDG
jgi:hypothetical protein